MSRINTPVESEALGFNDAPSRAEYLALFELLYQAEFLLDALAGRATALNSIRDEYRDVSIAIARARVEIRKTARASDALAVVGAATQRMQNG